MKRQYANEIKAIIILAAATILFASLVSFVPEDLPWYTSHPNVPAKNLIRIFGAYVAGSLFFVLGYSAYGLVVFFFFWGWEKLSGRAVVFNIYKLISFVVLFCSLSSLLSMVGSQAEGLRFHRSGLLGVVTADFLTIYFGRLGTLIILITLGVLTLIVLGEFLISPFLFKISGTLIELKDSVSQGIQDQKQRLFPWRTPRHTPFHKLSEQLRDKERQRLEKRLTPPGIERQVKAIPDAASPITVAPKPNIKLALPEKKQQEKQEHMVITNEKSRRVGNYQLPPLDLLDDPPPVSSRKIQDDLISGAKTLEETLVDFGVSVRVADIEQGPVITRYELEPAPGVKVQKITALSDDIALAMKAQTVRIVAPIPGKNRVGVEVPNSFTSVVYLKDVLAEGEFRKSGSKLTLALGKDITGKSLYADLAEMPHLLIAGTTGAGKTVCLNSVIMSMLFNATPDEVKFIMIDPKMVELSVYNHLPHALCPAVTDPKKVSAALTWVVSEMENRYSMLAKEGVRNIQAYNAKENRLPYIVVVVDELADLMQVAAKQIESAITRLSQLSRAVGIHLILATQRPSVDVITGVIKANFPARISFKVASKVDSRTVLDMNGADKLLGKGDMLFLKPGEAKPIRGQCSLVSDKEIQRVIDFVNPQQEPVYDDNILRQQAASGCAAMEQSDELYDEALRLVLETNQASVSILQRRMRLGYTRAARLIDMMEQHGIVGPFCGSKPRDILINREEWLIKEMKKQAES